MGTIVNQVRRLVIDGIKTTDVFNTADPETKQVPQANFGYKRNWKARERIWTGHADFEHSTVALRSDRNIRDEEATFELVIHVAGIAQDEDTVSARMDILGDAVEEWIAVHANWSGKIFGLRWITVSGRGSQTPAFNDKGVLLERIYPITYNARIA